MNTRQMTSLAAAGALLLSACGGDSDAARLPQLAAATGATLASCADLATRITFPTPR
jgi:hypothetical protein